LALSPFFSKEDLPKESFPMNFNKNLFSKEKNNFFVQAEVRVPSPPSSPESLNPD